jgi:hypothetical protein
LTSSDRTGPSGAQRPRTFLVPAAHDRLDAADAIRLAKGYGLDLDDWQQYVIECWLGRRRDGQWAASRCGLAVPRQNGKTALLEVRELFGTTMLGEKILHTAHEVKTARKAFARLLEFFDNPRIYPELSRLVSEIRRANGQEGIFLRNGASVEFVARSKGSARGFTVDTLICDEAQEFGEEKLAALGPTISAAPQGNPQTILCGTPPSAVMDGTVFMRMRQTAKEGHDKRLCWLEWSGETVEDANPALGYRLLWETIEDERNTWDEETFARERRGIWDEDAGIGGVFRPGAWQAILAETPDPMVPLALGVATDVDETWLSLGAVLKSGKPHLGSVRRDRIGNRSTFFAEVRRIQQEHGCPVLVHKKGPASVLIDGMNDAGIVLDEIGLDEFIQAASNLVHAVEAGDVEQGSYDDLDAAVNAASWRTLGDRRAFARRNGDISALEAVSLAYWWTTNDSGPLFYS